MSGDPSFVRAPANATEAFQQRMCNLGLATPNSRFCCGAMAAAITLVVLKPDFCYCEEGEMRKWKVWGPKDPDATYYHFFLVPLVTGFAFANLV
jgi:hypothetical protein